MRHRLATLTAVAMFALTLGAAPAFADSHDDGHGDHWVVVQRTTTDLKTYPSDVMAMLLDCSTGHRTSTYTLVSGFVDQVEMYRGAMGDATGALIAQGPGVGIETWTLRGVKVRSDQTGRIYRGVGSSRIVMTWDAGATYGDGPFTSGTFAQHVRIEGTRDGRSFKQVGTGWPMVMVSDHGTCSNMQLGLN
jgi:hypothetical protein